MTTNVSFKINVDDKEALQELLDSIGLSFSAAMNIYIKACINTQSIPFEIKAPKLNNLLDARLKESENESNLSPKFSDVDSLMESLDA